MLCSSNALYIHFPKVALYISQGTFFFHFLLKQRQGTVWIPQNIFCCFVTDYENIKIFSCSIGSVDIKYLFLIFCHNKNRTLGTWLLFISVLPLWLWVDSHFSCTQWGCSPAKSTPENNTCMDLPASYMQLRYCPFILKPKQQSTLLR